ncbi:MAG: hypothetical protein KY462_01255 [Actinobacteria bacterium]|nr:hypothetical protein [Actinomycetota bacterium]
MDRAQEAVYDAAWLRPLYRIGVAHAWRAQLHGACPSAWPGIAFWDVAAWRWVPAGRRHSRPPCE